MAKKGKKSSGKKRKSAQSWGENDIAPEFCKRQELEQKSIRKKYQTMHSKWSEDKVKFAKKKRLLQKAKEEKAFQFAGDVENLDTEKSSSGSESEDSVHDAEDGNAYKKLLATFAVKEKDSLDSDQNDTKEDDSVDEENDSDAVIEGSILEDSAVENHEMGDRKMKDHKIKPVDEFADHEEEDEVYGGADEVVCGEDEENEDLFRVRFEEKKEWCMRTKSKYEKLERGGGYITSFKSRVKDDVKKGNLVIRDRLKKLWGEKEQSEVERRLLPEMMSYRDVLFANETLKNRSQVRIAYLKHVLNHLVKSRDTITKNNEKARKDSEVEYRDQGFVRPTVLILTPLRSTAYGIVRQLISLLPEHVKETKNLDRFDMEFGIPEEEEEQGHQLNRGQDWEDRFSGNNDDCFQMGVSLSRRTLRLFSEYYRSDIIIASPLGLRMKWGDATEDKHDSDFLSSIEICVLDESDMFLMQNWDHVLEILKRLNQMPKASHDTDFSRIREYALEGNAKYYRQTILCSAFLDPLMQSAMHRHSFNYAGTTRIRKIHSGTISKVMPYAKQVFATIKIDTITSESDHRFDYFTSQVLPKIIQHDQKHTLLYIPSYFDYVRVRNYLTKQNINVSHCSEYHTDAEISRSRSSFFHGKSSILLVTERFHFFKRYHLRGIHHILFYSLPHYASFYPEMVNMLEEASSTSEPITVLSLFTKCDTFKLSRIVGSHRGSSLQNSSKEAFLFTS